MSQFLFFWCLTFDGDTHAHFVDKKIAMRSSGRKSASVLAVDQRTNENENHFTDCRKINDSNNNNKKCAK